MGEIATLVLPPTSSWDGAGVAVENVHAKGTRGEKVLEVGLGLESSQMEHVLAVESDKLEGALHVDIPFERVLREGESVHLGWSEDLCNARLHPGWARWVELDNLGNQILVVLVLGEGERLVPELRDGWSGSNVDEEGDEGAGAVLEHRAVHLLVQTVVYGDLGTVLVLRNVLSTNLVHLSTFFPSSSASERLTVTLRWIPSM